MKNKFFLLAITFCLPIHSQEVSNSFIPMAEIPAGSFYMGSDGLGEDFDEAPIHQVVISRPFRMGITEITNAQYESVRNIGHYEEKTVFRWKMMKQSSM